MNTFRKYLLVVILACTTTISSAQWINSLTVIPANPTPDDTIMVLAVCSFYSGGCSDYTTYLDVSGYDIYASALHCLGVLTIICNYTDTFRMDPLPAGIYTFHFQVDAGQGETPCTPGIVAGDNDSITFIVIPPVVIPEMISQDEVYATPNPSSEKFQIEGIRESEYPLVVEMYSGEGKLVRKTRVNKKTEQILWRELPNGVYTIRGTTVSRNTFSLQLLKNSHE